MAVAAVVAITVAAVLGVSARRRHAGLVRQLAGVGLHRTFAPRLSIQTEYRRCDVEPGPASDIPGARCRGVTADEPGDLIALQPEINKLAGAGDLEGIHADALVDLVWGDTARADLSRVVERLRQVAADTTLPGAPDALADLSGALIVRAGRVQAPEDLFEALDVAEQALSRDSTNLTALYNRALALDELTLDGAATVAWQAYLAADPSGGYATDARTRIQALHWEPTQTTESEPATDAALVALAASSPQDARLHGWDKLLGAWGDAVLRNDEAGAAAALHKAEVLGHALEERNGDATLADAVRFIRLHATDPGATRRLATGHSLFAEARKAHLKQDFSTSDSVFSLIRSLDAGSPTLNAWVDVNMAVSHDQVDPDQALGYARAVAAAADRRRYPSLAGKALEAVGVHLQRKNAVDSAVTAYGAAVALLRKSGEVRNEINVAGNAAETEWSNGKLREAYEHEYAATALLRRNRETTALHLQLAKLTRWLGEQGFGLAAQRVNDEDMLVSTRSKVPSNIVEARDFRAEALARRGETSAALDEIASAESLLGQLDPRARSYFTATLAATRGLATARTNPLEAITRLDASIPVLRTSGVPLKLVTALLARADANVLLGRHDAARADSEEALRLISDPLRKTGTRRLNVERSREVRRTLDRVVEALIDDGKSAVALELFEEGIAALSRRPGEELPLAMPAGSVAVRYAVIGDSVIAWTMGSDGVTAKATRVPARELERRVARVREALTQREDSAAVPELEALYEILVRPIEARLGPPETSLVIIPDGVLSGVPFSALFNSRTQRYLLEDHPLRRAATVAQAARPAAEFTDRARTAAVVIDPAFDPQLNPRLRRLPRALDEMAPIEGWAASPPLRLVGDSADVANVTRLLGRTSLVHFAGHAMSDEEFPDRSYLVLAPGGGDDGRLTAAAIDTMHLGRVALVVLSACSTLNDLRGGAGGFTGLGGAFLDAGAHGVIGSLWSVDDLRTSRLMTYFYQEYQSALDPAAALRAAQLTMLRSHDAADNPPAAWAGFEYEAR
jgi:CHAT domain-containing protein